MLIDLFLLGIVAVVVVDLCKLLLEQTITNYTPKHGRRRSV